MSNENDRDKDNAAGVEELEEQRRTEDTDAPEKQGGEATDKPINPTTGPTTADPNDPGTEPGQTQGSGL